MEENPQRITGNRPPEQLGRHGGKCMGERRRNRYALRLELRPTRQVFLGERHAQKFSTRFATALPKQLK
jgi:hypothetical protein